MRANKVGEAQQQDPLEQFLAETAFTVARDRRGLAIRLNTAQQRQLAAPFHVAVAGDYGEGMICRFVLDANGAASEWDWFRERLRGGQIEWPLRVIVMAADGETVRAIVRERGSVVIESRFIPAAEISTASEQSFLR